METKNDNEVANNPFVNTLPVPEVVTTTPVAPVRAPEISVTSAPATVLAQPVVYHTISGGPETLSELTARGAPELASVKGSTIGTPPPAPYAASGYSVPQREVAPAPSVQSGASILFMVLLVVVILIGAPFVYLYFYKPEVFNQLIGALIIIKNQILNQPSEVVPTSQ